MVCWEDRWERRSSSDKAVQRYIIDAMGMGGIGNGRRFEATGETTELVAFAIDRAEKKKGSQAM